MVHNYGFRSFGDDLSTGLYNFFFIEEIRGLPHTDLYEFFLLFFPDFFAYNLGMQCLGLILWLCLIISALLRSLSTIEETGTKLFTVPSSCWSRKLLHDFSRLTPLHGIFWLLRNFLESDFADSNPLRGAGEAVSTPNVSHFLYSQHSDDRLVCLVCICLNPIYRTSISRT